MKSITSRALLALLLLQVSTTATILEGPEAPRAREDLDSLLARARALEIKRRARPFRFAAKLELTVHELGQPRRSEGSLWVGTGKRVRLSMTFPLPNEENEELRALIVSDGKHLYTRTHKRSVNAAPSAPVRDLSITRMDLAAARTGSDEQLAILASLVETEPTAIFERARQNFLQTVVTRVGNVYLIKGLLRKPENLEPGDPIPTRIELRIDVSELLLLSQAVYDERGNELSKLALKDVRRNVKAFREGTFQMKIPEGVQVEEIKPGETASGSQSGKKQGR